MKTPSFEVFATANQNAADAFLQMSKIWLEGAERLSSLNLAACRELLEESAAAAHTAAAVKSVEDLKAVQPDFAPAMEKAMDYTRSLQAIVGKTQEQLTTLMNAQFSKLDMETKAPEAWNAALDLFTQGAKQMAEMTSVKAANAPAKSARKAA